MPPRRRYVIPWCKRDGARVLGSVVRSMRRQGPRQPRVRALLPFRTVRASTKAGLEKKIREAAKGKRCARVFIRADPLPSIKDFRADYWYNAPRGNLNKRTGEIIWESAVVKDGSGPRQYEFHLYATRPHSEIEGEGTLFVNSREPGQVYGSLFEKGKKILNFRTEAPESAQKLGEPLSDFARILAEQGYGFRHAVVRFVRWKDGTIEFFDFNRHT